MEEHGDGRQAARQRGSLGMVVMTARQRKAVHSPACRQLYTDFGEELKGMRLSPPDVRVMKDAVPLQ